MIDFDDDGLPPLDPNFADQFRRDDRRPACQLYLISPLDVDGGFPERLKRALGAGAVAAFQMRVKGVDAAVYDVIKRVHDKTFKGGIYSFGLKENGVGYIYDEHNRNLIPDDVRARVEQLKQDIIDGRIKVPSTR